MPSFAFVIEDDVDPPSFLGVFPGDGAVDISVVPTLALSIRDNDAVVESSMQVSVGGVAYVVNGEDANGALLSKTPVGSGFDLVIQVPSGDLAYLTVYALEAQATDPAGNVGTWSTSFTTRPADVLPPRVTRRDPAPGAVFRPAGQSVRLTLEDESGVDGASIQVLVGGTQYVQNGVLANGADGSVVGDGNGGYDIVIDPPNDFVAGQIVVVLVYADDIVGNSLSTSYSFAVDFGFDPYEEWH